MHINLADTFNQELPADPNLDNSPRQVKESCFSFVTPLVPSNPKLLHVSTEMADALGFDSHSLTSDEFLKTFTGATVIEGAQPYAMCYGGHQFGHWAGQLGDGRAINLGEIMHNDQRWALQLKGAGPTPYSRTADGLAVLRSSVREHLCSEAMYHLGVPTTRSLSLSLTGDQVWRDMMYDGNAAYEPGAIVCRVAPSFIRFGNFQILASRGDMANLQKLSDYAIKHFFPQIHSKGKTKYIEFFNSVLDRTLDMVVEWQRVGFVHGVMNTDNMSILGLTIDYGPYGWLEGYDPNWTPNTTDKQHKRYRYGHQPQIALWNLYQLANVINMLVDDPKPLEAALERYKVNYSTKMDAMWLSKLGLEQMIDGDRKLITQLGDMLVLTETDMTIFFRLLSKIRVGQPASTALESLNDAFYTIEDVGGLIKQQWIDWLELYILRLGKETRDHQSRIMAMDSVNPKYVLRNYMAQLAIDAAEQGDYAVIDELYKLLKQPYAEQSEKEKWFAKRPEWARHKVGCSMLSCSS